MSRSLYQKLRHLIRRHQRLIQIRARLRHGQIRNFSRLEANTPISVYGLFSSASGLGEAARCLANGLETLGRTVHRIDVTALLDPDACSSATTAAHGSDTDPGYGPILIHLNPVEAVEVLVRLAPDNLSSRTRVGVWIYELSTAPSHWRDYVGLFHKIWTPSRSSAASLAAIGAQSEIVPYRHKLNDQQDGSRTGSPSDRFNVILFADARSSLARKNVKGAIQAFTSAFTTNDTARLILKLSNLPNNPDLPELARPDIELIREIVSPSDRIRMIGSSDAMLSLHRAEGYGLSLIEAMLCGTALIMSDEPTTQPLQIDGNVWTVPCHPVPVDDPQGIYPNGFWSDADLSIAADQLRAVYALWQTGDLQKGRPDRQTAAKACFSDMDRLKPMTVALKGLDVPKTR